MRPFCSYLAKFTFSMILEVTDSSEFRIIELTKSEWAIFGLPFRPKENITALKAIFLTRPADRARPDGATLRW